VTFSFRRLPLVLILVLAAFLRLYKIGDYAEYLGDQGRDMIIVRDFIVNGNLFFIGPQTSIGNMYLGPYFYYLIAPSLFLSGLNPLGPIVFVALLGILTTYLVYRFSLAWFDQHTALLAAFLYTISPVIIRYTTFSWNPNIMPLFSLLFIFFIYQYGQIRQSRYLYYATLSFILCLNSHYLALLLLPPAFISLALIFKNHRDFRPQLQKHLLVSFAIFLLSLLPQILFDLKHQGQNITSIYRFFSQRETTVNLKPYKAIPHLFPMFHYYVTRLLAAKNQLLGAILSVFTALSFIITLFRSQADRRANRRLIYLSSWIFFGILGLSLYKQHVYDHYLGFIFPVIFIIFASLICRLLRSSNPLIKPVYFLILGLTVLSAFTNSHLRYPPNRQIATTSQIVDSILVESDSRPFNLALLAKQNYDAAYRYFFYLKHAPLQDTHQQITDQLYVICEPWQIDCQPINHPQWEIASFGWSKIEKQWQINGINIFKLVHQP